MTVDQVCENIIECGNFIGLKDIIYDSLNNYDQVKLEEAMIDMMIKFRHTPLELGDGFPTRFYKQIDAKWKWALSTEKKIRETTLAQVMPDLGKTHMSIALKHSMKKSMPRDRAYFKNKAHEVEKENIQVWKEVFGVLNPTVEIIEGRDAIEFEDAYKEEVAKLTEEIKKLVHQCKQQDVVSIKYISHTSPQNQNVLTKEDMQNLMIDTTLPCTNPVLLQVIDYAKVFHYQD